MKKVGIIAVCDFKSLPNGGEVFLLHNFLSATNNDQIKYYLIGMTFDESKTVGKWSKIKIGNREYDFFPVSKVLKDKEKTHIPFRLRVVLGLYKYKNKIKKIGFDDLYIHSAELGIPFWNINWSSLVYHVHGDPGQTLKYSRFSSFRGMGWVNLYYWFIKKTIDKSRKVIWAANRSKKLYLTAKPDMKRVVERKSITIHSSFDNNLKLGNSSLTFSQRTHLITVARLAAIKRIDFIITVVASLIKQGCDVDLLVCGDGEERENLEKQAKELGIGERVVFLGLLNRMELAQALNESEAFLFASESEAMSLVVLESLFMGVPVVSTNVGDLEDAVINDKTGFIVDGYNVEAYASCVKQILQNTKNKYDDACRKIASRYTPKSMADHIDEVFLHE